MGWGPSPNVGGGLFFFELYDYHSHCIFVGRIIGIDYGIKRCGLSVTDPGQIIVNPLKTVNTNSLLNFIKVYYKEEVLDKIVFGYPTHRDGNPTYVVSEIEKFVERLKNEIPGLEIDFQDENFTSAEAREIILNSGLTKKQRQDKSRLDKISAVLILQRYLGHI